MENTTQAEQVLGRTETHLGDSHFQLPIRQRSAQTVDTSNVVETIDLSGLGLDRALWHSTHPVTQANTGNARPEASQHVDRPSLADMAFSRLACGDAELLEATLDAGADIEYGNRDGLTLLVTAIKDSNVALTRLLLEKGADPQHRAQGKPPLFHAVQSQEHGPQLIRLLLDHGANINTIGGPSNMNALHWAAATGMVDAADYLLSRGMDIEVTCAGAHTALHVAAGTGRLTVVQLLLAQGADLSKRGESGGNALTFASCRGYLDIVKLCIEEGLSVDDRNENGLSEYRLALARGVATAWSDIINRPHERL